MIVYMVGRAKYARDLGGEGARLNGGRWNSKGVPCIYTSASRALAVLEYSVNVNLDEIPRALTITTIEIPDSEILFLTEHNLPGNWRAIPAPSSAKAFGDHLFETQEKAALCLPSSVIPQEYNYILNPRAFGRKEPVIRDIRDFVFDVRLK